MRRKLNYDLYYVERMSLWLDFRLILGTALKCLGVPFGWIGRIFRLPAPDGEQAIDSLAAEAHLTSLPQLFRKPMWVSIEELLVANPRRNVNRAELAAWMDFFTPGPAQKKTQSDLSGGSPRGRRRPGWGDARCAWFPGPAERLRAAGRARRAEAANDLAKAEELLGQYLKLRARARAHLEMVRSDHRPVGLLTPGPRADLPGPRGSARAISRRLEARAPVCRPRPRAAPVPGRPALTCRICSRSTEKQSPGQPVAAERAEIEDLLGQCSRGLNNVRRCRAMVSPGDRTRPEAAGGLRPSGAAASHRAAPNRARRWRDP